MSQSSSSSSSPPFALGWYQGPPLAFSVHPPASWQTASIYNEDEGRDIGDGAEQIPVHPAGVFACDQRERHLAFSQIVSRIDAIIDCTAFSELSSLRERVNLPDPTEKCQCQRQCQYRKSLFERTTALQVCYLSLGVPASRCMRIDLAAPLWPTTPLTQSRNLKGIAINSSLYFRVSTNE
jgi:hypothetical protein